MAFQFLSGCSGAETNEKLSGPSLKGTYLLTPTKILFAQKRNGAYFFVVEYKVIKAIADDKGRSASHAEYTGHRAGDRFSDYNEGDYLHQVMKTFTAYCHGVVPSEIPKTEEWDEKIATTCGADIETGGRLTGGSPVEGKILLKAAVVGAAKKAPLEGEWINLSISCRQRISPLCEDEEVMMELATEFFGDATDASIEALAELMALEA